MGKAPVVVKKEKKLRDMTYRERLEHFKAKKLSELTRKEAQYLNLVKYYPALKKWQGNPAARLGVIDEFKIVDDRTDDQKRRNILGLEF